MLIWQEVLLFESFMNGGRPRVVGDGSCGRVHVGDQVRAVFLARFGQMHLEPHPTGGAFRGT
jgi:hypothetical protein